MSKLPIIVLFLLMILVPHAQAENQTHFTVAIDPNYIPFTQKDIDDNPSGLLIDFWDLWAKKNGYSISYKFYPWEETLLATERGEVDFHSGTTNDREWMHASNPIYELRIVLFTKYDSYITTVLDLAKKRIGTIDKYYGSMVQKVVGNTAEIVIYDEYASMIEALKSGNIDAFIDNEEAMRYYFIKTGQMNRFKVIENKQLQFTNKVYAVTNASNAPLLEKINAGIKKLDLIDLVKLEEIWLPRIDDAFYNKKLLQKVEYTPKEQEWIKAQGSLTLTGDPIWVENTALQDSFRYRGVAGDYMKSMSQKMKIQLKPLPIDSWAEILATPIEESADIILGTMNDNLKALLEDRYTFLSPYDAGPLVIIMDKDIRFVTDLYDIQDKKIGLLSLQKYTELIEFKYADYQFSHYSKVNTLLDKVIKKEISVAVLPLADALLILASSQYKSLDIVGKLDEKEYVNIGIINSKPMLRNIVKKALQATALHYKQEILAKWTYKLNYVEKIDYDLIYKIIGLFSLLMLVLGYYAYMMKRKHHYEQEVNEKIKEIARTDDLTGLHNKREFNSSFEQEHLDKEMIGLLFIDVDYFKNYNDHHGHMQGDIALREVAHTIRSFDTPFRTTYRIGGEEFGMILFNHTQEDAQTLAKEVCKKVESLQLIHGNSPNKYLTVSIGVSITKPTASRHTLYQCADKALYAAKALGRNKVFLNNCGV